MYYRPSAVSLNNFEEMKKTETLLLPEVFCWLPEYFFKEVRQYGYAPCPRCGFKSSKVEPKDVICRLAHRRNDNVLLMGRVFKCYDCENKKEPSCHYTSYNSDSLAHLPF